MFEAKIQAYPVLFPLLCGSIAILATRLLGRKSARKYPPGPKGVPVFGNLFQLSMTAWNEFEKWKNEFGPIVYINAVGQNMVILNSHTVAADLLDRRSNVYSDRPTWIVAGEMLTRGLFLAFAKHGDTWRRLRRAGHESMNKAVVNNYYHVQHREAVILTDNLLHDSKGWRHELNRQTASVMLSILYDRPPTSSVDDPLVVQINAFAERIVHDMYPGNYLVEFFPWMRHFPSSIAGWKKRAEEGFVIFSDLFVGLFRDVERRINEGDERPSMAGNLIREKERYGLNELEASWLSAMMYAAGSETSASVMAWFMLAMVAYPDKQRKCQEELDRVVGRSRMPTFEDRDHLPYLRATVREAFRWRPVAPLGVHHYTTEDDWYQGYFIPKGTICLANIWSLNRDPDVYGPDADHFNPDRFIDANGDVSPALADTKDGHVSYGFGPRICLGRHLANNSLFINMACLLWAATITPMVDNITGNPVIPDVMKSDNPGMTINPLPFQCEVKPRFAEADAIVAQTKELWA